MVAECLEIQAQLYLHQVIIRLLVTGPDRKGQHQAILSRQAKI